MKQDQVKKWLDTTDLHRLPLKRPSKRRRLACPGEGEVKQVLDAPLECTLSKAHSVDHGPPYTCHDYQLSRPSPYQTPHQHTNPSVLNLGPDQIADTLQQPRQPKLGRTHTATSFYSKLRESRSDTWVIGTRNTRYSETLQAVSVVATAEEIEPSLPASVASVVGSSMAPTLNIQMAQTKATKETQDTDSSKRLNPGSSNYRAMVLEPAKVVIRGINVPLPKTVASVVRKVVFKCCSPEMDDATAASICETIRDLRSAAEDKYGQGFLKENMLPPDTSAGKLIRQVSLPWTKVPLPIAPIPDSIKVNIQTICEPKPDVTYGYSRHAFDPAQRIAQVGQIGGVDLSKYCKPAKDLYWPFFVVEFKASSSGGTLEVAENQNAGSGAASVMAARTLYTLASEFIGGFTNVADSVSFSAQINERTAEVNVHWHDAKDGMYYLEMVHHYDLYRSEDIKTFQMHARNIIGWGLGSRLKKIQNALNAIMEEPRIKNKASGHDHLRPHRPKLEPNKVA